MKTLERLWNCAQQEANAEKDWLYAFQEIGLGLQEPLFTWDYKYTPRNSLTFASTGGDSVHYSLLRIKDEITEESPVVMTVPFAFEKGNLIVGENLREFLCLGCRSGYMNLERLIYNRQKGIKLLEDSNTAQENMDAVEDFKFAPPYSWERERYLLSVLNQVLVLHPFNNPSAYLEEVNEKYLSLIELDSHSK